MLQYFVSPKAGTMTKAQEAGKREQYEHEPHCKQNPDEKKRTIVRGCGSSLSTASGSFVFVDGF